MEVKLKLEAEAERLECDVCEKMMLQGEIAYITTANELEEVTEIRCEECFKTSND